MARPKKIQWPINFEEMLRYAFETKRPEDRLKFFRLFLRDFLHTGTTCKATPEEMDRIRTDTVVGMGASNMVAMVIPRWPRAKCPRA